MRDLSTQPAAFALDGLKPDTPDMRDLSTAQATYLPTDIAAVQVRDWIEHGHLDEPGYGEVIAVWRDDEAEIFEVEVRVERFDYDCWPYNRTGRYHVVDVDFGCTVRRFVEGKDFDAQRAVEGRVEKAAA